MLEFGLMPATEVEPPVVCSKKSSLRLSSRTCDDFLLGGRLVSGQMLGSVACSGKGDEVGSCLLYPAQLSVCFSPIEECFSGTNRLTIYKAFVPVGAVFLTEVTQYRPPKRLPFAPSDECSFAIVVPLVALSKDAEQLVGGTKKCKVGIGESRTPESEGEE